MIQISGGRSRNDRPGCNLPARVMFALVAGVNDSMVRGGWMNTVEWMSEGVGTLRRAFSIQ